MEKSRLLIVDDEQDMLDNLDRLLSAEGYRCWTLSDPLKFRQVSAEVDPHVLISDIRMPGADGTTVMAAALADDPALPVILITAYGSIAAAVEAVRDGAFDYLAKPFSANQLSIAVERAVRYRRLFVENRDLREKIARASETELIGTSRPFTRLLNAIRKVADTSASVLILGESGTGKELVARAIHRLSGRSEGPFLPVDCASLPEGLLESELFGHERGAFTGAVTRHLGLLVEASGGTLFLDEVGEMSLALQAKLLRTLEERVVRPLGSSKLIEIDIRVVAATNVDLGVAVAEGRFREDLFYRLNVVPLVVPPLRERREDVVLLAERFLTRFSKTSEIPLLSVAPKVWQALERYDWPGNVRQLRNVMERIAALHENGPITLGDLPPEIWDALPRGNAHPAQSMISGLRYQDAREQTLRAFRASYVTSLLRTHGDNVTEASRAAGVSRRTLHRWLTELRQDAAARDDAGS